MDLLTFRLLHLRWRNPTIEFAQAPLIDTTLRPDQIGSRRSKRLEPIRGQMPDGLPGVDPKANVAESIHKQRLIRRINIEARNLLLSHFAEIVR